MKILIEKTISMITGAVLSESWCDYDGPVAECKGEGAAQSQLDQQNKIQQDQIAQQKAIRDNIMGSMQKYLSGSGEGFDPQQMAVMTSQFLNQNTSDFNAAGSAVKSALAARGAGGGDIPVGGDYTRGIASLEGAKATSQSQGVLGINLENLKQALMNRFNAANVASGQTAQIGQNVSTAGAGANNALDQYVKASNSGFGANFMDMLGKGLGDIATGGIGTALGGIGKYLSKAPAAPSAGGGFPVSTSGFPGA